MWCRARRHFVQSWSCSHRQELKTTLLSQPPSQLTSPPPQPMRLRCFYPAKTCLRHPCHKMSLRQLRDVQVHSVIITFVTTRHNTLPSQPSKKRCRSRIRRGVPTLLCSASKGLCFGFPAALPTFFLLLSGAHLGVLQRNRLVHASRQEMKRVILTISGKAGDCS